MITRCSFTSLFVSMAWMIFVAGGGVASGSSSSLSAGLVSGLYSIGTVIDNCLSFTLTFLSPGELHRARLGWSIGLDSSGLLTGAFGRVWFGELGSHT